MNASSPDSRAVGFIGLGLMGRPMAGHLLAALGRLWVHNRSQPAVEDLVARGAQAAASPADLARRVGDGVIILMLPNAGVVRDVVEGPRGITAAFTKGLTIVDMGSTRVDETRRWREMAVALGGDWIDAPVSGGQKAAEEAALSIMAGGERSRFDAIRPLLEVMGDRVTYLGPSGAGQITKLANQILVANTIASVSEALHLLEHHGVDLAAARTALLGGFASSRILDLHGERMISGNFTPGGTALNQLKDVDEAARVAREAALPLPMLEVSQQLWSRMVAAGLGDLDHSGLYEFYRRHLRRPQA